MIWSFYSWWWQILHPSRQQQMANPCGADNGNCSHLCLLSFNGTFSCHCPHVMKLAEDRRSCVRNERVLLFSRTNEIRGVDLDNPYYHIIPPISLPQVCTPRFAQSWLNIHLNLLILEWNNYLNSASFFYHLVIFQKFNSFVNLILETMFLLSVHFYGTKSNSRWRCILLELNKI